MPLTKVSSGVIAANAVVDSFGTQSITGDKIGLGAITGNTLASNIINANNIVNASITGAKLVANTVSGDVIGQNAISSNNIVSVNASIATVGTLPSARLPEGSVLQVVANTTGTTVTSSTSTYVDTTLTATITPKFATSKILVLVNQNGVGRNGSSVAEDMKLQLQRNGTGIANLALYGLYTGTSLSFRGPTFSISYLDSPATTSATTYKTQFAAAENAGTVQVQIDGGSSVSTITLLEIAQ